jgi:hypothetical protein
VVTRVRGERNVVARRRDLALHGALFVVINAFYLTLAWPEWLWVTAIWGAGLAVHAWLVWRVRPSRPDGVG